MAWTGPRPATASPARRERFELAGFIDNLTETYSHGMRQRLVFAIALLHDPEVLVVDEPMVGLDPRSARVVKDLLRAEADAGKTVLMSTHTLAVAEEIADRIGILNRGQLDFLGTLAELRQELSAPHQALEHLFLEVTNGHASPTAPALRVRASGAEIHGTGPRSVAGRRRNSPHDGHRVPGRPPILALPLPSPEAESRGFLRLEWRILRTQFARDLPPPACATRWCSS